MIPVKQQIKHDPKNGQYGDCQRAVIASLLELPLEEVPHFNGLSKGDSCEFHELLQEFVGKHGYIWYSTPFFSGAMAFGSDHAVYHEIAGPSPRDPNTYHAVVGRNGQIVHDPHPDNTGLAGEPKDWTFAFLVHKSKTQS